MKQVVIQTGNMHVLDSLGQEREQNRYQLFKKITLVTVAVTALAFVAFALLALLTAEPYFWLLAGASAVAVFGYLICLLIGKYSVDYGLNFSMLTTLIAIVACVPVFGTLNAGVGTMVWVPIQAGLLSRHRIRDVILSSLVVVVLIAATIFAEHELKLFTAWTVLQNSLIFTIYMWVSLVGMIAAGIIIFTATLQKTIREVEDKALALAASLQTLQDTNQAGQEMTSSLATIVVELSTCSEQQATGATEQASAVTEVTTSLVEISESASQIATAAATAAQAANETVTVTTQVQQANSLAQFTVTEGNKAVEQTIHYVQKMRNRIELLGQRLLKLTEQTRRVTNIIELIEEITDETHLLALNASIEAAGGTQHNEVVTSGTRNTRGERFGIIAQEIKNLSDRSREATEEVRQSITEMQGSVAEAVLVAEEGKKDTAGAVAQSEIADKVIRSLNEVISNTAGRTEQILLAFEEVKVRCDEISLATNQQRTANQQTIVRMQPIQHVAQINAGSAKQINLNVNTIESLATKLQQILDYQTFNLAASGTPGPK